MTAPVIKLATFKDTADIATIHVRSWQQTYKGLVPQNYLDSLDIAQRTKRWDDIFSKKTSEDNNVFIAYDDNTAVGFVSFGKGREDDKFDGYGEIYAIYLLQRSQGKTIGYRLFNAACEKLKNGGFKKLYLWVLDNNATAIAAYQRWGGIVHPSMIKDDTIGGQPVREIALTFDL